MRTTSLGSWQRPNTRRWLGLGLVSALIIAGGAGCKPGTIPTSQVKSATSDTEGKSPVGEYTLTSVDGNKIPCTLEHEGHTVTIQAGGFRINADGTCGSRMTIAGMERPIEVRATYIVEGSRLKMMWQGAGTTVGTYDGDTFTMNNEGMVLAYRK